MRKAIVIEYDDVKTFEAVQKIGFDEFGSRIFSAMMDPNDWRDAVALEAVYEVRVSAAEPSATPPAQE